jgi:molecular chaperone DnaK
MLEGLAGQASEVLTDDDRFRRAIIDPAWELMPAPVRFLGRDRVRWDALLLALRDQMFEVQDARVVVRGDVASRFQGIAGAVFQGDGGVGVASAGPAAIEPPAQRFAVGIDLGTTYSVIAHLDAAGRPWTVPNAEGDAITPSVVLFDGDRIVVGKEALKAASLEPDRVARYAKRDMGSPVHSKAIGGQHLPPEVIQSLVLEKLRVDAEARLGTVRAVVITVPAYFNEPRRKATQDAGRLANLEVLDIINEPTAAAIAHGVQFGFLSPKGESPAPETVLVFDLGGGTFDATLMRIDGRSYRTLATAGDVQLGGLDWDNRLIDHVATAFRDKHHGIDPRSNPSGLERLAREVEEAKRSLSARETVTITFEHAGQAVRVPVTRDQFEAMTADLLERTRFTTSRLLSEAGVKPAELTRVLLVGGSTRMPMVARMLRDELGREPDRSLAADEAVAHGAAIYAGLITDSAAALGGVSVRNVNSHSLGVLAIEHATGRNRNRVLVPRNSPLPIERRGRFQTRRDNQKSVEVRVIEGGDASGEGATMLGTFLVKDLPPGLPAGTPIEVVFRYMANGRLDVEAWLPTINARAEERFDRASGLGVEQVDHWRDRLRSGLGPLDLTS